MRVVKTLIEPGEYYTPQGKVLVTPSRIKHWVDQWKRMNRVGIRIPVSWGHQPGAVPDEGENLDVGQYKASKFNAGFVSKLWQDAKGRLVAELDVPALRLDEKGDLVFHVEIPDCGKTFGKIGEVSIGVRDWLDGSGKNWQDSLIHVALTPLPVWHGQKSFTCLSTLCYSKRYKPMLAFSKLVDAYRKRLTKADIDRANIEIRRMRRIVPTAGIGTVMVLAKNELEKGIAFSADDEKIRTLVAMAIELSRESRGIL